MSTGAIIGIIIAIIVVAAIGALIAMQLRRARIRRQFGPEYDRLATQIGPRKAEAELTARQRRVEALGIRPLPAEQQARYSSDWAAVQEQFVDSPAEAVSAADTLTWNVMRDRGYPVDDRNASLEALSVYYAGSLEGYRQVRELRLDSATTEELREAMIRHRALFEDLTGLREGAGQRAGTSARAAGTGDLAAPDRDLAAEDTDRTADTPR